MPDNRTQYITPGEYERRHGELMTVDSRQQAELDDLDRRLGKTESRQDATDDRIARLENRFTALETRVAFYAAGGALVGGAVVSILADVVTKYFFH